MQAVCREYANGRKFDPGPGEMILIEPMNFLYMGTSENQKNPGTTAFILLPRALQVRCSHGCAGTSLMLYVPMSEHATSSIRVLQTLFSTAEWSCAHCCPDCTCSVILRRFHHHTPTGKASIPAACDMPLHASRLCMMPALLQLVAASPIQKSVQGAKQRQKAKYRVTTQVLLAGYLMPASAMPCRPWPWR